MINFPQPLSVVFGTLSVPKPWRRFTGVSRKPAGFLRAWYENLRPSDKGIILAFLLMMIVSLGVGFYQRAKGRQLIPAAGGVFKEAVLAASQAELDKETERLTNVGLVRFNDKHEVVGAVATSWDIKQDGKEYDLTLQDRYHPDTVRDTLLASENSLSDVTIEARPPHMLVFKLVQPFGPFLEELTRPLLPYGPFRVTKHSGKELTLEANPDSALPAAMGFANIRSSANGYNRYQLALPREMILFFNLDRKNTFPKDVRQKLKDHQTVQNVRFTITTSNSPATEKAANDLKAAYEKLGARVDIRLLDLSQLEKDTIPKRDYEALLFGIDFGPDPDPYPFWHSSQIGGKGLPPARLSAQAGRNLSQFVNKDADKLLEDARLTTDAKKRQEKYAAFQEILDQEAPAVFLGKQVIDYQVAKAVKGVVVGQGVTVSDRFANINEWYVKTKRVKK
ncbi:hypothetical protein HY065_00835 [Candidatus Berkelbacteria bacterium]|nr:hypothetical protein [Candidatus Berkelbacteria bacterium]